MNQESKQVDLLHAEYLTLIGGDLSLTLDRIYWWSIWRAKGWGVDELRLVIRHIQSQIKKGKRFDGALRWSRLIQQADAFEEELILARAEMRNTKPHPTPRERVIAQARPTIAQDAPRTTKEAKPISELIANLRNAVNLK